MILEDCPKVIIQKISSYIPYIDLSLINKYFKQTLYQYKFTNMIIDMNKVYESNYEEFIHFLQKHTSIRKVINVRSIDELMDIKKTIKYITQLFFRNDFNEKIEANVLPESLTHLGFEKPHKPRDASNIYSYSMDPLCYKPSPLCDHSKCRLSTFRPRIEKDVLPQSLTHLYLGDYLNQKIEKDVLPQSLIVLH